jgi:hypothetical protein
MLKGLNDFLDKHEGRKIGRSTHAIEKERKHQGYDGGHKAKALKKAGKTHAWTPKKEDKSGELKAYRFK